MNKEYAKKLKEASLLDYVWKHDDWLTIPKIDPKFLSLSNAILDRENSLFNTFGDKSFQEIVADNMANEIKKSWAIEDITLDLSALRSLIVNFLNFDIPEWQIDTGNRFKIEGSAVEATLSFLNSKEKFSFYQVLTTHKLLKNPSEDIHWGSIRKYGIHVLSSQSDDIKIDYVGPSPELLPKMLEEFVSWWDESRRELPRPIGSALAHLYFVVIHPFENGNGRISRMLADKYLIEDSKPETLYRPYSISNEIL